MLTDYFSEVYVSMSRNRLRIALTGFSIAWGIFMLIVLLGSGNGLLHGMMKNFGSQAMNTVTLYPGNTTKSFEGLPQWREIHMTIEDVDFLSEVFTANVESYLPMMETSARISHGQEYVSPELYGVTTGYMKAMGCQVTAGRDINELDQRERRKVLLITQRTSRQLFGDDELHIGEWVNVADIPFQIVGYYKDLDYGQNDDVLAPFRTIGTIFCANGHLRSIRLIVTGLNTEEANEKFTQALRSTLAKRLRFDETDRRPVWIWNAYEDYLQTQSIFAGLRMFIWIIGLATLIAGVTGISNIMLITVRERTHEFGIRKALGARPRQIVSLVILESIAITLVFGYVGLFCGIGLTQLVDYVLTQVAQGDPESFSVFINPTVDLEIVVSATLVMVIAGVIAGYVPAKRAVSVKPVEALAAM
ncbi:MAG: ABC transporter permease [Bacteroidales bacterium]|nr:ABC transporter permease [Bacteroidales bacterium]